MEVRLSNHRVLAERQNFSGYMYNRISRLGGTKVFVTTQVWSFTPYDQLFFANFPEMKKDLRVDYFLDAFTKYEARMTEQAIITYIKPSLNNLNRDVQIDFLKWTFYNQTVKQGVTIVVHNSDHEVIDTHNSMRSAQSVTGINRGTLRQYMNTMQMFHSDYYGELVSVADISKPIISSNIRPEGNLYKPVSGIDLYSLELNYFSAYREDMSFYGKYFGFKSLVEHFGNSVSHVHRRLNQAFLITCTVLSTGEILRLYFCRNPNSIHNNSLKRPVYLVHKHTGEQKWFATSALAAESINVAVTHKVKAMSTVWLTDRFYIIKA